MVLGTTGVRYTTAVSRRSFQKRVPRPAVLRPLGAQLRRLRLDRRMTQETLAELASLNYKYIGRVELGKADPGADVLVRLARALSVPVGELFETITPSAGAPRLPPAEVVDALSAALQLLEAAVDKLLSQQPRPPRVRTPGRAR